MKNQTMKRNIQFIAFVFLSVFILLSYQNCSKVQLEPYKKVAYSVSKIGIDFCTTPADAIQSKLKFIFVVDKSGSNKQRQDPSDPSKLLPGTDPSGAIRFPNIINFLTNFNSFAPENTYYSYIKFSTTPTVKKFDGENFTNNKDQYLDYVELEEGRGPDYTDADTPADLGATNYTGTLNEIYKVVQSDITKAELEYSNGTTKTKIASTYIIFFISDGEPRVLSPDGMSTILQPLNEVLSIVGRIADFQNTKTDFVDGVSFNTAYYYVNPLSATAALYLEEMAKEGFGTFLKFSDGQPIDFTKFSIPPRIVRFGMKELWLVNPNSVWDGDQLAKDLDMDGVSDEQEKIYESNPVKYDSDGNGLGDGVEVHLFGKPCTIAKCAPQPLYTNCNVAWKLASHYSGVKDTDLDDLNDCEEVALKSNIRDPDTNHDYIPDGLAMRFGVKIVEASNASSIDPDFDGVSDYAEVKYNSPITVRNSIVPSLKLTTYGIDMTKSNLEQDCYHLDVNEMAFLTEKDKYRVYIMEETKTVNERKVIRRAEGASNFGIFNLDEGDFVSYQP